MRLRLKPTDDRVIQKLNCDGDWVDWFPGSGSLFELSEMMRTEVTEIAGRVQGQFDDVSPDPLECVEYDLILPANNQVVLPVHIGPGDLITITNARGYASENEGVLGIVVQYFGPEGGSVDTDGSYPLSGSKNMRLIMNVGGTWYDAYTANNFAIPAGVVQDNLVFMVNDTNISNNLGTISFHVKICKAEAGIWSEVFEGSRLQTFFEAFVSGHPRAEWTGTGWGIGTEHPSIDSFIQLNAVTFSATRIVAIRLYVTAPLAGADHYADIELNDGSGPQHIVSSTLLQFNFGFPGTADCTSFFVNVVKSDDTGDVDPYTGEIHRITVYGTATKPPEWTI